MKVKYLFSILFSVFVLTACDKTVEKSANTEPKVFLLTLDGLRWQEVFSGIDSSLMNDDTYTSDVNGLKSSFWDNDSKIRRNKLMPFLWNTIAKQGQVYGNRWEGMLCGWSLVRTCYFSVLCFSTSDLVESTSCGVVHTGQNGVVPRLCQQSGVNSL